MVLTILMLPLFSTLLSGLMGRYIGNNMGKYLCTIALGISTILSYILYYNTIVLDNTYKIVLSEWINIDMLDIYWSIGIDSISVTLLVTIGTISTMVHWYSIEYMGHDPHQNRFFSQLSLFTIFMMLLVLGDNYLVMFVGWEMIGVASYLLISFWYTSLNAAKSGLNALLMNKFGDTFLTIGLFILLYTFGSLNYSTIFSISMYINTDILVLSMICILMGATAKSAQLGLHTWLIYSMAG
jgi:NADH-ubiquinone oxidoreductase chain 5